MRYVIVAPTYRQNSAGIVVLYELQKWLIRFGQDAIVLNWNAPFPVDDDDIVVYPEVVSGNPLGAKHVVRYILNIPGKLGGDTSYDKTEKLIAYDEALSKYSNGRVLKVPRPERFFFNKGYERTVNCFWVGKGKDYNHPVTRNCIEITYQWPARRYELAELLNRTKTLYTYDECTALIWEAINCGCDVRLIKGDKITCLSAPSSSSSAFSMEVFKKQLREFIKYTSYDTTCAEEYASQTIKNRVDEFIKQKKEQSEKKHLVSIIILTHNQLEYTKKCIDSIFQHTKTPFELIIVDNNSTDGTVQYLKSEIAKNKIPLPGTEQGNIEKHDQDIPVHQKNKFRIKIIENKENKGFAEGNNQGIIEAKGDYILLLNNDTVVTPGWLERLIYCSERKPEIGIAGPKSNYVSGPQSIKDVPYDENSLSGLNEYACHLAEKHARQFQYHLRITGFCMLIKREVIQKIGGFDIRYKFGNLEDSDFCLRTALAGFDACIAEDCFVHHFGNRTFIGSEIDYTETLLTNWKRYKEKWGIPSDLKYGEYYDITPILKEGFIPAKHYCPLDSEYYSIAHGEELFKMGNIEEARTVFQQILIRDENNIDALNNLGVIAFMQNDSDMAVSYFRKVLKHEHSHIEAIENLANCLTTKGKFSEALRLYKRLLALGKTDTGTLNQAGNCLIQLKDMNEAYKVYKKSLELDTSQKDVKTILQQLDMHIDKEVKTASDNTSYRIHNKRYRNCPAKNQYRIQIVSFSDIETDVKRKLRWGDYWVKKELEREFQKSGNRIVNKNPDIILHMFGAPTSGFPQTTYKILWIHSHPSLISPDILRQYDKIYCLSPIFLKKIKNWGFEAELLVGGTAKTPLNHNQSGYRYDIVFVGNTKEPSGRKIIRDLGKTPYKFMVWGEGWKDILSPENYGGIYYENERLPELYASSKIVLNDHHDDMRREGFLNPRILDIFASGGFVISDNIQGMEDLLGDALVTYKNAKELNNLIKFYINHPEERMKIIKKGQAAARQFTFSRMVAKILSRCYSDIPVSDNEQKTSYSHQASISAQA